jgi:hypothetical protein
VALIDELASWLGATRVGRRLVVTEHDREIVVELGGRLAIRVDVPELAGASLAVRLGDTGMVPDANTGEAAFDAAWTIAASAPELAPLVVTRPARDALEGTRRGNVMVETAVELVIADGAVTVLRHDGDRALSRIEAAVDAARAVARRPDEIRDEIGVAITALDGRRVSPPWTWRDGVTAELPCGRSRASLAVGLEAERPVVRVIADADVPLRNAELCREPYVRGDDRYRPSPIPGMLARGEASHFTDAEAIAAIAPTRMAVQDVGRRRLPRCEITWQGWLPPVSALRAAVAWTAAVMGDATSGSPYR